MLLCVHASQMKGMLLDPRFSSRQGYSPEEESTAARDSQSAI